MNGDQRDALVRDLFDRTISRLFDVGVRLQAVTLETTDGAAGECITRSVDELDRTIRDLRAALVRLSGSDEIESAIA